MLHHRIRGILDSHQPDEQIGFRNNVRIEDAFLIYESLIANSLEFNMPIWVASLDLRRAFDQIEFSALVEALRSHNLPESYIHLILALYSDQDGAVQ